MCGQPMMNFGTEAGDRELRSGTGSVSGFFFFLADLENES